MPDEDVKSALATDRLVRLQKIFMPALVASTIRRGVVGLCFASCSICVSMKLA